MRTRIPVLVVLMLLAAGCSSGSKDAVSKPAASAAPKAVTTTPAAAPGGGGALKIAGFAYGPTPLTVKAGQKVAVTNTDSAEHTVTSDMAGLFVADDVKKGKPVTFTVPAKVGAYTFHCEYHPQMHGKLVVTG